VRCALLVSIVNDDDGPAWQSDRRNLTLPRQIASGVIMIAAFAPLPSSSRAQTGSCYPPKYTASSDLVLPEDFHEWVYVGSPLAPNALNKSEINSSEFYNVYTWTCSYATYKKDQPLSRRDNFFQGAATHPARQEPRRFTNRARMSRLFSWTLEWCRCNRQGFQALCRYWRMGIL
jgi:hypothetical protein